MKKKFDKCSKCGKVTQIVNKGRNLCYLCNHVRLHGMTPFQKRLLVKAKDKNKRKSVFGEKELFLEIWNERPHVCTKCNKKLLGEPKAGYFSHIKSKGAYPELRLVKTNIEIVCLECHYDYEFR